MRWPDELRNSLNWWQNIGVFLILAAYAVFFYLQGTGYIVWTEDCWPYISGQHTRMINGWHD